MGKVAVVGSANADLVVRVERRPGAGETLLGSDLEFSAGGKGANTAAAAGSAGAETVFLGALGDDGNAQILRDSLTAAGVDITHVATVDRPTGTAMIILTPDGENSIIVSSGANATIDVAAADAVADVWLAADVVVMNLEIPMATVEHVARRCAEHGVRVVLNAAPAQSVPDALLAVCDPLVVNEHEAQLVLEASGDAGFETLAQQLLQRGARSVVITLGADGSVVADHDQLTRVAAHKVEPVDTTGAGDAFVGAVATEVASGRGLVEAARFATAMSAIAVTRPGAAPSYPTRAEVLERYRQD